MVMAYSSLWALFSLVLADRWDRDRQVRFTGVLLLGNKGGDMVEVVLGLELRVTVVARVQDTAVQGIGVLVLVRVPASLVDGFIRGPVI